jgi:hypothetical protein
MLEEEVPVCHTTVQGQIAFILGNSDINISLYLELAYICPELQVRNEVS